MEKQKLAKKRKEEVKLHKATRRIVCITSGDIVEEKVDVVCNSIGSPALSGFGGAIGGSIVRACGSDIKQETHDEACKVFSNLEGKIPIGKFVSTTAGEHKWLKFVLHCVLPRFNESNSKKTMTDLVTEIFDFCNEQNVEAIAVPPMGSGVLQFPVEDCCECFFDGIMRFLSNLKKGTYTSIRKLNITIYEQEKAEEFLEVWENLLEERYPDDAKDDEQDGNEDSDEEDVLQKKAGAGMKKNQKKKKYQDSDDSGDSSDEESKEVKKSKKKSLPKKSLKKRQPSSDSSSDSEVESKPKKKTFKKSFKQSSRKRGDSSSCSDSDEERKKPVPKKKTYKKRPSSDSDSDSDDAPPAKKSKFTSRIKKSTVKKSGKAVRRAMKRRASSSSSSSD